MLGRPVHPLLCLPGAHELLPTSQISKRDSELSYIDPGHTAATALKPLYTTFWNKSSSEAVKKSLGDSQDSNPALSGNPCSFHRTKLPLFPKVDICMALCAL